MQLRFVVLLMGLAARRLQKRRAPPALPQHGLDAATLARLAAATRKLERSYAAPTPGDTVRYYASREPSLGRRALGLARLPLTLGASVGRTARAAATEPQPRRFSARALPDGASLVASRPGARRFLCERVVHPFVRQLLGDHDMFGSAASRALSPEARAARVARLRAATDFLGGAHNLIAPVFLKGRLGLDGGVAATRVDVDGAPDDAYYAWFEPTGTPRLNGTLVYLHGGGFIIGSKATNGEMVARIAAACGVRTLFVAYRKLPEAPFPGALVDALRGVGVALASTPPERLILGGDSAGASLALAALHFLRETLQITPAAGLLLSPMVDIASELEYATDTTNVGPDLLPAGFDPAARREFMDMYWGSVQGNATVDALVDALRRRRDGALLSPLAASPRQLGALPPLLCQAGGSEVLLDSQLRFCDAARRAGADVRCTVFDGEVHAFHAFGFSPAWPAARADLRRFCERALRPAAPAAAPRSHAVVAALVGGSRKRAAVAAGIRAFR